MIKLNVIQILENKTKTKYWLFNEMNKLRSAKEAPQISYTNFQNLIEQKNLSIKYKDIEELCKILDCKIDDLLIIIKDKKN